MQEKSEIFLKVYSSLDNLKKELIELSLLDLSKIHVGHEWSWMPYMKDHIDFLIEQTDGLLTSIHDSSPPASPEDLEKLKLNLKTVIDQ